MMRICFLLSFVLIVLLGVSSCGPAQKHNGEIGWKNIDTNIIVYNNGIGLRYYQYASLISNGDYVIIIEGIKRELIKCHYKNLRLIDTSAQKNMFRLNLANLERKSALIPSWNRKLISNLPLSIDTDLVIHDQDNTPLKFYQYFGILLNNKGHLVLENGKRYIFRYSDGYINSYYKMFINQPDSINMFNATCLQLLTADKIVVIKNKRKLYVQRLSKTILSFTCNLGRNPVGDKHQEGDKRTPEGLYTLVGKTNYSKYGKAYYISYPDAIHTLAAKLKKVSPGGEIMIHGTSEARSKLKDWTNGCIALSNAAMDSLFRYVVAGTPIEIRK